MGANQPKGQKTTTMTVEDSSFFKKQMIIHTQMLKIQDKYTMEKQIGQGTYSTVFQGKSIRSQAPRCIKRVDKSKAPGIQQILLNQFAILRELDHPNVMNIYGLYEDHKYFYVITELIKGRELFCEFKDKKNFDEAETFEIFRQVLLCIHNLHKNKIMHRDIKLENMIYNPKTRLVKLIDFGTAVEFTSQARGPYKLAGTASYIAPEVITKNYNYMCDVWSLGVFLHLLLTGTLPFVGKNQEQIFHAISTAPPNLNSPVYEKIPQAKALVSRMLQKSPQKRITIPEIIKHPWYENLHLKQSLPPTDHECMLNLFQNMRKFSTLKIADIQLGILVFIVNFIIQYDNEDSIVRCFHWIDFEGDGVVTIEELAKAFVEYEDRPEKKANQDAKDIMNKIDFNHSMDIDYSEFLVASTPLKKIINDDTLQRAFRMLDSDLSGNISFQELKDHLGEHVSEMHYKNIMGFCDLNKTGQISLKEFKDMMKRLIL